MNPKDFKRGIAQALRELDFRKLDSGYCRHTDSVATFIMMRTGRSGKWHVDVGFWLKNLDRACPPPSRVEHTHLFFRLESLIPKHHETIVVAGLLDDEEQQDAFERLIRLLPTDVDRRLRELGDEQGLRRALLDGELDDGFVMAAARDFLTLDHSLQRGG